MLKQLESNLRALRGRIAQAAAAAGRSPDEIELVCVTKGVSWGPTAALAALGELQLGESRVPALLGKLECARRAELAIEWHFIGHVQRNKARKAVLAADVFHSVDSIALLDTLERVALEEQRRPRVYLEVKLVERAERSGFSALELGAAVDHARGLQQVSLAGLMTLGPIPGPGVDSGSVFRRLAALRDELDADAFSGGRARLSMGMSEDLEPAIAAGADVLRVGSVLFAGVHDERVSRDDGGASSGRVAI